MEGFAHFLLPAKAPDDSVLLEARKGDIFCIPPGYGHVTINPTLDETLTMANLVSTAFSREYALYENMHGAARYELIGGTIKKNPAYGDGPPLQKIKTICSVSGDFGIHNSLYEGIGNDRIAGLLNNPEHFNDFFIRSI
jgi:glucose-6-phosphate isomerase